MKDEKVIEAETRAELIGSLNYDLNVILKGGNRSDVIRALSGAIDTLGTLAVSACTQLDRIETDDYIIAQILKRKGG